MNAVATGPAVRQRRAKCRRPRQPRRNFGLPAPSPEGQLVGGGPETTIRQFREHEVPGTRRLTRQAARPCLFRLRYATLSIWAASRSSGVATCSFSATMGFRFHDSLGSGGPAHSLPGAQRADVHQCVTAMYTDGATVPQAVYCDEAGFTGRTFEP